MEDVVDRLAELVSEAADPSWKRRLRSVDDQADPVVAFTDAPGAVGAAL